MANGQNTNSKLVIDASECTKQLSLRYLKELNDISAFKHFLRDKVLSYLCPAYTIYAHIYIELGAV